MAHKENLTFLHASFADYLKDSSRSGEFYVGYIRDVERVVAANFVEFLNKCSGDDIVPGMCDVLLLILNNDVILDPALVESTWHQYCSKVGDERPSSAVAKFHATLFNDIIYSVSKFPHQIWNPADADLYELPLLEVHLAKLCYHLSLYDLTEFVTYEVNIPTIFGFNPEPHHFHRSPHSRATM